MVECREYRDIGAVLKRIGDDLSAFYLLGYYSTNTAFDGRFRRIEVRVKPAGIQLTSRRGLPRAHA